MNYEPQLPVSSLAKVLTNLSNALSAHTRRVGMISEHQEEALHQSSFRLEQALAGSTEMLMHELCCQFKELHSKLDLHEEKLRRIHNLGCWWEKAE